MVKNMAKENIQLLNIFIKVFSIIINSIHMVLLAIKMVRNIKGTLIKARKMVKVSIHGQMGRFMKDFIEMMLSMARAVINYQIIRTGKDNGLTEKKKVLEL